MLPCDERVASPQCPKPAPLISPFYELAQCDWSDESPGKELAFAQSGISKRKHSMALRFKKIYALIKTMKPPLTRFKSESMVSRIKDLESKDVGRRKNMKIFFRWLGEPLNSVNLKDEYKEKFDQLVLKYQHNAPLLALGMRHLVGYAKKIQGMETEIFHHGLAAYDCFSTWVTSHKYIVNGSLNVRRNWEDEQALLLSRLLDNIPPHDQVSQLLKMLERYWQLDNPAEYPNLFRKFVEQLVLIKTMNINVCSYDTAKIFIMLKDILTRHKYGFNGDLVKVLTAYLMSMCDKEVQVYEHQDLRAVARSLPHEECKKTAIISLANNLPEGCEEAAFWDLCRMTSRLNFDEYRGHAILELARCFPKESVTSRKVDTVSDTEYSINIQEEAVLSVIALHNNMPLENLAARYEKHRREYCAASLGLD